MTVQARLRELRKAAGFAASFLRRRLVHTNLQLLYDCNFRCRICDFWKGPKEATPPPMSLAGVTRVSEQLALVGPQIVSIGGGEPLLHPDIVDVVEVLSRHHFPVMICNGWYVTPAVARALFRAGMYEISVSVDYADPSRHDTQRGVEGAYERAVAALRILHESRTEPWQRVHMISVVMDDNLDHVERLIEVCAELGITYLVTLYSDARGSKACRATDTDTSARLLELKERHPEFVALRGYLGRFSEAVANAGVGPCRAGRNLCNVDCQGNVSRCIDRKEDSAGNLFTDDVHEIVERLRESQERDDCRSCWTSCRGSIEALMYGGQTLGNLRDYWRMARPLPLTRAS